MFSESLCILVCYIILYINILQKPSKYILLWTYTLRLFLYLISDHELHFKWPYRHIVHNIVYVAQPTCIVYNIQYTVGRQKTVKNDISKLKSIILQLSSIFPFCKSRRFHRNCTYLFRLPNISINKPVGCPFWVKMKPKYKN